MNPEKTETSPTENGREESDHFRQHALARRHRDGA